MASENDAPGSEGNSGLSNPPAAGNRTSEGAIGATLREWTTTAIAALVVGSALIALWRLYGSGDEGQEEAVAHFLSLLGVVMGYYFGRTPAELRANQAENKANEERADREKHQTAASFAEERARVAEGKVVDARVTVAAAAETLGRDAQPVTEGAPAAESLAVASARQSLQDLQSRL